MKKFTHYAVIATIVCASAGSALGITLEETSSIRNQIVKSYPKIDVYSIEDSTVPGLFAVSTGENVIYYNPKTGSMVFGEIWNSQGVNETQKVRDRLGAAAKQQQQQKQDIGQSGKIEILEKNRNQAIKIGNGKNIVYELTDPDCPYCRKMDAYWKGRTDVTRYVFLMPIAQLHPQAPAKVKFVLNSADKVQSVEDVFDGKYDKGLPAETGSDNGLAAIHASVVEKIGVNGTPAFWVNGTFVHGANVPAIESALKAEVK